MTGPLLRLAGSLILMAIVDSALWSFLATGWKDLDFLVGVTAFSVGVLTFFGVAALNGPARGPRLFGGERLRTALACSLLLSYLFIVCFTTFVKNAQFVGAVTREFVHSYANVVGVTIAFYFGASAA